MAKQFALKAEQIRPLIIGGGGCIATDEITVKGRKVDYMYRDVSRHEHDSGWQFMAGTEERAYLDNPDNSGIYDVNTIANYDPAIIAYLSLPVGTELERVEGTDKFQLLPG